MKKFILSLGLVAMMLNLTNCAQYDDVNSTVEPQGDFEIYASVSRTANDGLNTVWATGDDLGVFHAVTDGTTYTKDGQFKLNDIETGRFLGNVNGTLDSQEEYDWYAMYPYSSYVPGPANTGSGYMTIGAAAGVEQTQLGNNSMAHVAGKNFPLVGKAYAVPAGTSPALAMTHVASLVEFEITNSLEEAFTVSSIQFIAPEKIAGTFYIDFTDVANITAASSGDSYTSLSATLAVSEGVAIEKGASAKFYLPVAPFVAKAGKNLTVVVTATSESGSGAHEKSIALTSDVAFKSGKIKNVKVNYTTPFAAAGGGNEGDVETTVTHDFTKISFSGWSNSYAAHTVEYDEATVTFTAASKQTQNITNMPVTKGQPVSIVAKNAATIKSAKFVCKQWTTKGQTITLKYSTDGGKTFASTGVTSSTFTISKDNLPAGTDAVQIVFNSQENQVGIESATITYVTNEAAAAAPRLSLDPSTVEFTAEGGSEDVTCTVTNAVDGVEITATPSASWVSASVSGNTITITAEENTVTETRTANVVIAYEGAESETITVNQAAKVDQAAPKYVKVTSAPSDWSGTYLIVWDKGAHATVSGKDLIKTADVTIVDDAIASSATVDAAAVTIAKISGSNYSLKLPNGKYLSLNANSNQVAAASSAFNLTFGYASKGVEIKGNDTAGNTRYVVKNGTYYRAYKSVGSYVLPTLYKLTD